MDNSKKDQLSKVVLNVTTYETVGDTIGVPVATTIDITDILYEKGVTCSSQINGISDYPDGTDLVSSRFVVGEPELNLLSDEIDEIIDAAIVNEKQGKAIKRLIMGKFDDFKFKHWEQLRKGDIL